MAKFFHYILGYIMNGLIKARKLQKNADFQLVYKHGTYEINRYCVIYKMPVNKGTTKVGFVTGKKVGCAVERNRARRLLREVYRLHQREIREGYHIVIVARQAINGLSYTDIEGPFMKLMNRSKLLKK